MAFVRLGRPQFLVGGFLLYGIGTALGVLRGARLDRAAYALGQGAITSIQLMTHYANDYFDLAADRANATPTRWSGGSRVLPGGILSPRLALQAARILGAMALLLAAILVGRGAWAAAGTLVLAEVLAWFYSAPPLTLHSRGLGELTTAVVVTGLTPLAGFLLQSRQALDISGVAASSQTLQSIVALGLVLWPLFGLQFAMLLAIEFPDAAGDGAVGKRTLVVRFGGATSAGLYRAVLVAVYGALPLLLIAGAPSLVALAVVLPSPVAGWQFWRLGRGDWNLPERWEGLAFGGVTLLVATAACELAALCWLIVTRV